MRTPRTVTLLSTLVVVLAGCMGGDTAKENSFGPETSPVSAASPNVTIEPPVADFFPSPTPAQVDQPISFDASKSFDPEGGNLTFSWDLGDGTTADGVQTEHAYAALGSYRIILTAASDASNLTARATLTVDVIDPDALLRVLDLADPAGDATADASDLVRVRVRQTSNALLVAAAFTQLPPNYGIASPIMLDLVLNDVAYEVRGFAGEITVYDATNDANVPGATVTLLEDANALAIELPLASITVRAPYRFFAETRIGEPSTLHGQFPDDRLPDAGHALYEP